MVMTMQTQSLLSLTNTFTITSLFTNSFLMQLSTTRFNSDCADIYADVINGTCTVMYKNSNTVYRYFNVSRRALFNLCNQPNMSVGFWINANLFNNRVQCYA